MGVIKINRKRKPNIIQGKTIVATPVIVGKKKSLSGGNIGKFVWRVAQGCEVDEVVKLMLDTDFDGHKAVCMKDDLLSRDLHEVCFEGNGEYWYFLEVDKAYDSLVQTLKYEDPEFLGYYSVDIVMKAINGTSWDRDMINKSRESGDYDLVGKKLLNTVGAINKLADALIEECGLSLTLAEKFNQYDNETIHENTINGKRYYWFEQS